jgi:ribosomal-protein-alanine acetyltransferase
VKVRLAREEDRQAIAALETAAQAYPWGAAALAKFPSDVDMGWVIEHRGGVGAWLAARLVADEGELLNMAVLPELRQQGLGRRLVSTLLAYADGKGVERLFLEVRASNMPAQTLYRRCGFAVCGRRKQYYRAPNRAREDAILMQRLRSQ